MAMIHTKDKLGEPTKDEKDRFAELGIHIDSYGRPENPDKARVIGTYGLRLGKGDFWHWGPNYTVDPIVIGQENGVPKVLTIERSDTGKRALPGGFVDSDEDAIAAAIREATEETTIDVSRDPHEIIYTGHVRDPRETLHAWPETTAILFRHEGCPSVTACDDAKPGSAAWLSELDIPEIAFHGSHLMLIEKGFRRWHERQKNSI